LRAVTALEKGRSNAKERPPVAEVPDQIVMVTIPQLSPEVGAMVRLQLLTAARPGEVCSIRPRDVDRTDPVCWHYRPESHKTQHLGRERLILIGPRAQEVLRPWLHRDPDTFCFCPAEVVAKRTKAGESTQARRPGKRPAARPTFPPGPRTNSDTPEPRPSAETTTSKPPRSFSATPAPTPHGSTPSAT
jgi:integrase